MEGLPKKESSLLGVSIRGWITLLIVFTACTMFVRSVDLPDALNAALFTVIGWYFGQKSK